VVDDASQGSGSSHEGFDILPHDRLLIREYASNFGGQAGRDVV
jgi:hypothetical protein